MIKVNSLIGGKIFAGRQAQNNISPIDGTVVEQVNFLSEEQLVEVFTNASQIKNNRVKEDYTELLELARFFRKNRLEFIDRIMLDSGFTQKDCEDLIDCSIEFCEDYESHLKQILTPDRTTSFSFKKGSNDKIKLTSAPYGLISATTPRNTPLITELTVIVHALWSGNALVLRPSPGVAGTVSLLIEGLRKSFRPETLRQLSVVFSDAKNFVGTGLNYSNLLHYVGSTKYMENTLVAGIEKGVKVLVDGDGCSMVIVDRTASIEEAAKACYQGLIRCNGEICISVRVVVVEKRLYEKFTACFLNLVKQTIVQPPNTKNKTGMGPLFSSFQVENILSVAKKYQLLQGNLTSLEYGSNYISPIVVGLKPNDRNFLRESVFGPIVGISYFKGDDWKDWLKENPINLTDAVFSNNEGFIEQFLAISNSPRKVVNLDPTVESVFEPWGAFLPSGLNDVSYWYHKYRRYYQLVRNTK